MGYIEDAKADIAELDRGTLHFFDQWTKFKQVFLASDCGQGRSCWHVAMTMIAFRIVENLDAVRLLTIGGRPPAAYAIYRAIYEGWLNLLLIGFHRGSIEPRLLRDNKTRRTVRSWSSPTKRQLARRFIAFGWHGELEVLENHKAHTAEWERERAASGKTPQEIDARVDATERRGLKARALYGFGLSLNTWTPFKGLWHQREHIWPGLGEGEPIFPRGLVPLSPEVWRDAFYLGYREGGHFVHGSSATHGFLGRDVSIREAMVEDRVYLDSRALAMALSMAALASATYADAMGALPIWNRQMAGEGP